MIYMGIERKKKAAFDDEAVIIEREKKQFKKMTQTAMPKLIIGLNSKEMHSAHPPKFIQV